MKFDIDFIDEQVTNYFLTKVDDFCEKYPDRAGSMVGDFMTTKNLFIQSHDDNFHEMVDAIKSVIEKKINKELMYRYVHMVDYTGGGELLVHAHDHIEDYVYILYLNTCEDGATYFVEDDQELEVFPEANKLVHYSASLPHGARYSSTKKVLVGGLVFP
tara:strand:+ start:1357 stop:1833 length:477 start_codon:yes stop_codon:yes gene_type:complete